jgi:hypothetical protein
MEFVLGLQTMDALDELNGHGGGCPAPPSAMSLAVCSNINSCLSMLICGN